jgi:hypothetical protein
MKKHAKASVWICIVLSFVNLAWLGYNSYLIRDIPDLFIRPAIYATIMMIGLLFFFFSHLILMLSVMLHLKSSQAMTVAGIILLVLGVISFVFLLFHFVSLHEIADDFSNGYSFGQMLKLTWHSQVVLLSFFLYSLIYFTVHARLGNRYTSTASVSREQIYVALNIIGIVCGLVGILIVLFYFKMFRYVHSEIRILRHLRRYDIVPYGFVLLPYLIALAGWGIRCLKDRRSGWYDEKQNSDINRAGMTALLVSIPLIIGLTLFCFLKTPAIFNQIYIAGTLTVLWLPFYLFVILFVFSASALYHFKIR